MLMADKKITQLDQITQINGADTVLIIRDGVGYRATVSSMEDIQRMVDNSNLSTYSTTSAATTALGNNRVFILDDGTDRLIALTSEA